MSPSITFKRAVRIGGASGGYSDRSFAISRMAKTAECDVIVGDWLAEMTMAAHGAKKAELLKAGLPPGKLTLNERVKTAQFSANFVDCFKPAITDLKKNGIKMAVNAGSCDSEVLALLVKQMCEEAACPMNIAWVEGDDVTETVRRLAAAGETFPSLTTGKKLNEWGFEPINAQAYLGGLGIARAFKEGADIVICGRVADASPTIGAAAWWHDWSSDKFDELAGALIAGHLIECSGYVTGGNYSGFKDVLRAGKHLNVGFPIVEVDHRGECVLTKEKNTGGVVNIHTATSQLIYEIQGPLYYNSDVTADIENAKMEIDGEDRVRIWNIKGLPPPATTKIGITAQAGWQAEWHVYFVGLDIAEKARWTEEQILESMGPEIIKKYSLLKFHLNGSSLIDAENQDVATVDFRIFGQSPHRELLSDSNPDGFIRRANVTILESAPGASLSNDMRLTEGKPYFEYWVALFPQSEIQHKVHFLFRELPSIDMPTPKTSQIYSRQQRSYETSNPVDISSFGETVRAPLGYVVLGRGGDKSSDCNNGFFVRHDDEWDWLRTLLSSEKIKELLGNEYKGKPIDRFELPYLRAVHFLFKDHLDRGFNACSTYDTLGKNCIEYLRAKTVNIPKKFLDRGRI